ncbi:hypothetical protein ACFOVU_20445 [Nocardiopsis sediminis]|uniref:Secreted protein n=1 Tax=Nocardiopsis sediminis TaxID=1778267 RepID=A0ABV8FTH1_9ACTN
MRRVQRADSGGFQVKFVLFMVMVVAAVVFGLPQKAASFLDSVLCPLRGGADCESVEAVNDVDDPLDPEQDAFPPAQEQDPFAPTGDGEETWPEAFDRIVEGVDELMSLSR